MLVIYMADDMEMTSIWVWLSVAQLADRDILIISFEAILTALNNQCLESNLQCLNNLEIEQSSRSAWRMHLISGYQRLFVTLHASAEIQPS